MFYTCFVYVFCTFYICLYIFYINFAVSQGKSIGLVLGGGGARGAAHVGMLRQGLTVGRREE